MSPQKHNIVIRFIKWAFDYITPIGWATLVLINVFDLWGIYSLLNCKPEEIFSPFWTYYLVIILLICVIYWVWYAVLKEFFAYDDRHKD